MMILGFRVPPDAHGARRHERRMKSDAPAGVEPANIGKEVDSQPITAADSSTLSGKGRRQDGQLVGASIAANWVGLMTTSTGCVVSTNLDLCCSLAAARSRVPVSVDWLSLTCRAITLGCDVQFVPPDLCKPRTAVQMKSTEGASCC